MEPSLPDQHQKRGPFSRKLGLRLSASEERNTPKLPRKEIGLSCTPEYHPCMGEIHMPTTFSYINVWRRVF